MSQVSAEDIQAGTEFKDTESGLRAVIFSVHDEMATVQFKGDDLQISYKDVQDLADPKDPDSGKIKTRTEPAQVQLVASIPFEDLIPRLRFIDR